MKSPTITFSQFSPQFSKAFSTLNVEWISKYFEIEDTDVRQLNSPGDIVNTGGQIFFAFHKETPVGTCALINLGDGVFELAKMAVTESCQGLGIGARLFDYAEDWAIKRSGEKITLSSNTVLTPALALYEKKGFVKIDKKIATEYSRCNIQYEKFLKPTSQIH